MLRELLASAAVYSASAALARLISFVLLPLYTAYLLPAEYGFFDLVLAGGAALAVVLTLEVNQGVGRELAATSDAEERRRVASTALWFVAGAALLLGALGAAALTAWGAASAPHYLALAVVAAAGLNYHALCQLRWERKARGFAAANLAMVGTVAAAAPAFLAGLNMGLAGALLALLCGYCAGAMVALALARQSLGGGFSPATLARLLRFSAPLALGAIAAYALQVGDRAIVAAVAGLDELGVYGVGARCASIITVVVVGFRGATLPALYAVAARADGAAQIGRALRLYAAVCLVLVALLWLAAEPLVALLAPPQFARAAQLVGPLALGAALSSLHLFSPGLLLAGRTRLIAQVQFAAVAVYFLLCWQLTRLYGGPGAAAAYVLAMAGQQAVLWRLARRHFPAPQAPRTAS